MKIDAERKILMGEKIECQVVPFNDKCVLEACFIQYDGEVRAQYLKMRKISADDFEKCDELDEEYHERRISFRSVRIFHVAHNEIIRLNVGDKIRGIISKVSMDGQETKDGRRKLHITLSNVIRVYRWSRRVVSAPHCLVVTLFCGTRTIKEKEIPLAYKKGIQVENGRAHPAIAEALPDGSILRVSRDYDRAIMTTGDYRLAQRQKHRTMQDIEKDFLRRVPAYDRLIPVRERKWRERYGIHA